MNAILRVVWLACYRNRMPRDLRTIIVHGCRHAAFNTETRTLKREMMRRAYTFQRPKVDLNPEIVWTVERAVVGEERVLRCYKNRLPWGSRWRWYRLYSHDVLHYDADSAEQD